MLIERRIAGFLIRSDATLREALLCIDANKSGLVFCVNDGGLLEGVLTDGDFRRWLLAHSSVSMDAPVIEAANRHPAQAAMADAADLIAGRLSDVIRMLPLLDASGRVVAVARRRTPGDVIWIGGHAIGAETPCFVIAEVGINHNGSPARARQLVDAAVAAGADCVKFQMRNLNALYRSGASGSATAEDLGAQYTLSLLTRFELPPPVMFELFDYARARGLTVLCTPWDPDSLAALEDYGMEGYKIASADLTNHDLILRASRTYKPLLVSTGMSSDAEIVETVALLRRSGTPYVLLHCNSTYPAPFKEVQLKYLHRLREIGQCEVGYSGHERGFHVPLAALACGAKVIEKHITLDRALEGSDHKVSLLPDEFRQMVEMIRQVEESLGQEGVRRMSQGEVMNRANLAKSLIAARALRVGDRVTDDAIMVRSPGRGLQPNRRSELVGRTLRRDIAAGDFFYPSDLSEATVGARAYQFRRPWGVTVRWHDYRQILAKTNPDFLEFHLSFKDMDEPFESFFDGPLDLDLKVHSPDTFAGDHLLDLSNESATHRDRSVAELQRVVDLTRALKPYFRRATRPVIIASLGGFSTTSLLDPDAVRRRYDLMADSLARLEADGVEIVGQTLPPFPWYFGGQLFLNLFVAPHDTAAFCAQHRLRLCFDLSHSKLACTHFKWSFKEFIDAVGPHTAHLHIADAKGVDGEGLQVGDGEIDLPAVRDQLDRLCPAASFIPEIWQGHKNEGEGFWIALDRLEKMGW
ncbi:MAG: N-acetylneuraminate synthase family protein [Lentisphaerae bacterium]|nr:N-acetylneuraminate synthase family protein [Lentisphaerota bacterium]